MTQVCILVPHSSALLNSIVGLFKIFDLANRCSPDRDNGPAFELHLVGSDSIVELYGRHFAVAPDLTLAQIAATDVVIIPTMAGNIAATINSNRALVPWIQQQYRAGAEIAGLCTGASFIAETALIHDGNCCSRWFVDATFRKQYSQIGSLAERTAIAAAGSIHSDSGAWLFMRELLERVVGKEAAGACSTAFQDLFNRECHSLVCVSHLRRRHDTRVVRQGGCSSGSSMQELTAEHFILRFQDVNPGCREGGSRMATVFEETFRTAVESTHPRVSCGLSEHEEHGDAHCGNTRGLKALLKKIEGVGLGYHNDEA
jgi:putative intracellular protease/amidase